MPKAIIIIDWLVLAVCIIVWALNQPRFVQRLSEVSPETYARLGYPTTGFAEFVRPDEISGIFSLSWFLLSGGYRVIPDERLQVLGGRIRCAWFIAFLSGAFFFYAVIQSQ
jgi:hypothetical protein